ncbi:hypothetical protein EB796_008530 [Bugula neritina]|uniref:Uncharacterized protein n=1 Tax=Bugula neritina TaxID=10212 RepID=A0A7J7K6E4_BUGNE|nr:hypothetical protein EB796_008530 [Bugula neritina]
MQQISDSMANAESINGKLLLSLCFYELIFSVFGIRKTKILKNSRCCLSSYWQNIVFQLYSRMMKAEAKVESLTFQKKLIVTQYEAFKNNGYNSDICYIGVCSRNTEMGRNNGRNRPHTPTKITAKCRFRAAVRAVTTMHRIKWLIARSKTLIRDGIQNLYNNDEENP